MSYAKKAFMHYIIYLRVTSGKTLCMRREQRIIFLCFIGISLTSQILQAPCQSCYGHLAIYINILSHTTHVKQNIEPNEIIYEGCAML
jgi:hypothetical protein